MKNITIELSTQKMSFAAGHFLMFSETDRENLHGHNFSVTASISLKCKEDGYSEDYNIFKNQLIKICDSLNQKTLLPKNSKFLELITTDEHITAIYNGKHMQFLQRDILVLDMSNISVEGLAQYFILEMRDTCEKYNVSNIKICVSTSPGQGACMNSSEVF